MFRVQSRGQPVDVTAFAVSGPRLLGKVLGDGLINIGRTRWGMARLTPARRKAALKRAA